MSKIAESFGIHLPAHGWKCRNHQRKVWNYMTRQDGKRKFAVLNWHRRAGKDLFLLNLIAFMTTVRAGMYWHCFPQLKQGRKAIWEGYTRDGIKFLDYIPDEIRSDVNQQELRVNLKSGSTYMICGADNPDANLGAGPIGIGFSEAATSSKMEQMWKLSSPMLGENGGWVIFISTPRGKNWFYNLYKYAENHPDYFAETLTVEDTWYLDSNKHRVPVISQEYIQEERDQGKSEEFIRQEYYGDWSSAVDGAIFAKELKRLIDEDRFTNVPYDPNLTETYTICDLGYRDETVILFYQITPQGEVRIFDMFHDSGEAISYYCQKIRDKPYHYKQHRAPHDVSHKSIQTGNTTMEIAREHGINFVRVPKHEVNDGLESVRAAFPRLWIDKRTCEKLVDMLKLYKYEWSEEFSVFSKNPVHDESSHYADALRYLCYSLPRKQSVIDQYKIAHRELNQRAPDDVPWDILN